MALNLIRNSRVFFTTYVNSDGIVAGTGTTGGFTNTNTFEIQVQDGFSFSQNTTQETVTLNEAGATPIRGQRSFNTSLEPVDWSFNTYIRPKFEEGTTPNPDNLDDYVDAEEAVLWNALAAPVDTSDIGQANAAWIRTLGASAVSTLNLSKSNTHQLKRFGLVIVFEDVAYYIHNCALESASIDFGLDAISSIAWSGKGTSLAQVTGKVTIVDNTPTRVSTFSGGFTGTARLKDVNAKYIANKLSTMTVARTAGLGQTGKTYTVALTGGNLTIANNLTYLTPANLGVVNAPVTYFTGTRAVTASVNAYLKTGTNESSTLLSDILTAAATDDENQFAVVIDLGGTSNGNRVSLDMPTSMLGIPSIASEQVISTAINIMPQASNSLVYDIEKTNELTVKYYASAI